MNLAETRPRPRGRDSVAIRVPSHPVAHAVIVAAGVPTWARRTSAITHSQNG